MTTSGHNTGIYFDSVESRQMARQGLIFSILGHAAIVVALFWLKGLAPSGGPLIVAAGPGQGEGGVGGAVEVGVIGASEWLRFYPEVDVAPLGDKTSEPPAVEKVRNQTTPVPDEGAEALPRMKEEKRIPEIARDTDRPVARTPDRPYATDKPHGTTSSTSALIGVPGSPFPRGVREGVGIGLGTGGLAGIPGGSEYGRRLQQALIGYYRLTLPDLKNPRFVVARVRIGRDGRVLSIENGRLDPDAFLQKSPHNVINYRVEGALLELNRRPIPFPANFLPGVQEAAVEIYFQY